MNNSNNNNNEDVVGENQQPQQIQQRKPNNHRPLYQNHVNRQASHRLANTNFRVHSSCRRLKQDYMMIMKDPVPYISVAPLHSDFLEWHYVIRGPENTVYQGGIYHGKLRFPIDYPFKPPSIYMITPNGRFKTNTRLCLSFSDFHPDTWNPTWNLSSILTGLLSFMLEEHTAVGSLQATDAQRKQLAKKSLQFNLNDSIFVDLFPEIANEIKIELERQRKITEQNNSMKNAVKSIKDRLSSSLTPNGGGGQQQQENGSEYRLWNLASSLFYSLVQIIIFVIFGIIVQWVLSGESFINR